MRDKNSVDGWQCCRDLKKPTGAMLLTNGRFANMVFVKCSEEVKFFCKVRDLMARVMKRNISIEVDHTLWLLEKCSFPVCACCKMVA